jgi:putative endonuclease
MRKGLTPGHTFTRRPVKLVHSEYYERIVDAIAAERRIKGWSRPRKKVQKQAAERAERQA